MLRKIIVSVVAVIAIVVLAVTGCTPPPPAPEGDPVFTIHWLELGKEVYAVGEEVTVFMILVNEAQEPVTVNGRFAVNEEAAVAAGLGEVFFIIKDSAENELPFLPLVRVYHPEEEDFVTLQPGERTAWVADLTWYYELSDPGEYIVQAVYHSVVVPAGVEAWVGALASNVLILRVED